MKLNKKINMYQGARLLIVGVIFFLAVCYILICKPFITNQIQEFIMLVAIAGFASYLIIVITNQ